MLKSFKEKNFNLKDATLKNAKFDEEISHYEAAVTKKIKLSSFDDISINQLINKNDISIEENYLFNKEVLPSNLKAVNHVSYNYLTRDKKRPKCILIKNKDEEYNRDVWEKIQNLAVMNPKIDFLHVYNTESNWNFLKEKLKFKDNTNLPQIIILPNEDNQDAIYFPEEVLLSYRTNNEEINNKLNKLISLLPERSKV
jgi:hypothetical protein